MMRPPRHHCAPAQAHCSRPCTSSSELQACTLQDTERRHHPPLPVLTTPAQAFVERSRAHLALPPCRVFAALSAHTATPSSLSGRIGANAPCFWRRLQNARDVRPFCLLAGACPNKQKKIQDSNKSSSETCVLFRLVFITGISVHNRCSGAKKKALPPGLTSGGKAFWCVVVLFCCCPCCALS